MGYYRIAKMTDHRGNDKEDPTERIGRVMELNPDDIVSGKNLFLECVEPGFLKSMITTPVKKWKFTENGLQVTTRNTIYLFEKENRNYE